MRDISLEELLEAGCHFGHQTNRRNPKADDYIFEARSNVHIINLEKTREGLIEAGEYLKKLSQENGYVIFVGTKRQAKQIVKDEVERARSDGANGIFFVTSRWVGGSLTNFPEVSKNFKKLRELNDFLRAGKTGEYTKREIILFERERDKLNGLYGGIEGLDRLPDALCIIGTQLETTAVSEAVSNGLDIVGIVDTNTDPSKITYPIPANDDAVGSIKLITSYLVDAWVEGSKEKPKSKEQELKTEDKAVDEASKVDEKEKPAKEEKKAKSPKKKTETKKSV